MYSGKRLYAEAATEVDYMDKYVCGPCGYVYNPEEGDTDSGVSKGTPFAELPDEWVCPVCGAGKDAFELQ